ncbi:MAG: hypothetical protein MJZ73_06020 [Bacteroidaceae bacterium]|nr:hypothetical protein [Bacteroidaceae bacterium]
MDIAKIRMILNGVFILGALASIVIYFTSGYTTLFLYVILISIAIKVAEFFIRYMF